MNLRNRLKDPETQIRIGLVFLIIASFSRWYLHPGPGYPENVADGVNGLLYGVSIGAMLLGIWRKSRRA